MGVGNVLQFCGLPVVWLLAGMITVDCGVLCLCDGTLLVGLGCLVYCLCVGVLLLRLLLVIVGCGVWFVRLWLVVTCRWAVVVYFCLIINSVVI